MEYLKEPFIITTEEMDVWSASDKINTYFEIVCILNGEGEQFIEHHSYTYKKGSIFLLPASNCHTFKIRKRTRFAFLKLANRNFLKKDHLLVDFTAWCNQLNFILGNYSRKPGELVDNETDKNKVLALVQLLQDEFEKSDLYRHQIMQSSVVAIMSIIARNIGENSLIIPNNSGKKIAGIIQYVHHNLVSDDKISIKALAAEFGIAKTYFSEYFKRNSGETFQDFVIKSKLKVAEARAFYTYQSVKEIAYELGFTDSSHLNKMMKKYNKKSVSDIRGTLLPEFAV